MAKKKEYIFVRGAMPTVVWDPKEGKALAEFCDPESKKATGVFATTDKKVADRLREMGYKEKKDFPDGAPLGGFEAIPPEDPDHITPGGPIPQKKKDIKVEKKTVTKETLPDKTDKKSGKKSLRRRK